MTRQPVNSTWEHHKSQINTIKTTLQNKILQRYANRCNTTRNVRVRTFQTVTGLMSQQSTNSNSAEWCRLSSQSWRLTADFAGSVVILSKSNRLLTFATLHFAFLYRKPCCLILALCLQNITNVHVKNTMVYINLFKYPKTIHSIQTLGLYVLFELQVVVQLAFAH